MPGKLRVINLAGQGIALALILSTVILAARARADVYKYVDSDGVVHFTDAPIHKNFQLIIKDKVEPKPSEADSVSTKLAEEKEPPSPLAAMVLAASARYNLDPNLVMAVIEVESNFNSQAVSPKGAMGLMQLMPGTVAALGVANPFNPWDNIEGGVRHLAQLLSFFRGNLRLALAAYNAGKEAVLKYGDIPPIRETRNYVRAVMERLKPAPGLGEKEGKVHLESSP